MYSTPVRLAAASAALLSLLLTTIACSSEEAEPASSAAPASVLEGEPVLVGFANTEGAGAAGGSPEVTRAALAAERYVNTAGGIGGRPIQLVPCATTGAPESSIACANTFVQKGVVAVIPGLDQGVDSMLPILDEAAIPVVGVSALGPKAMTSPQVTLMSAPATQLMSASFKLLAEDGAQRAVYLVAGIPGAQTGFDLYIKPFAEQNGLDVSLATYAPSAPDYTTALAAARARNADTIVYSGDENGCTDFVNAAKRLGFTGRVLTGTCTQFVQKLGARAEGVQMLSLTWPTDARPSAPTDKQKDLDDFESAMAAADLASQQSGVSMIGFAGVVNLARVLTTMTGPIDGPSVSAGLGALRDFDTFAGQKVTCDPKPLADSASCGTGVLALTVTSDGSLEARGNDFYSVIG